MAVVWSYLPHEKARTIIDLVHQHALPLEQHTGLCASGDDCAVRRVRLCETVQAALGQAVFGSDMVIHPALTMRCATGNENTPWTRVELDSASRSALALSRQLSWEVVEALPSTSECGTEARAAAELTRAPYSCPFETLGNGQSSREKLERTPTGNGCPVCSVALLSNSDIRFIGKLDPVYLPIVSSPVLRVHKVSTLSPVNVRKTPSKRGTNLFLDATVDERLYELSGLLDVAGEETNVALDTQIDESTQQLEVMLEYMVQQPDGQLVAHGVTLPLLDLR
jgi:hypothetical protein